MDMWPAFNGMKIEDLQQTTAHSKHNARHIEQSLQISCVRWFDLQYPSLRLRLHHSPNGGKRNSIEAAKFKAMGTRAGFPDFVLLVSVGSCPFLGIELKTDKGKQSPAQHAYQEEFEKMGARYEIVRTIEEFIDIVNRYINGGARR